VVKRDGRRERFDRQKLLRGLARAAGKRPLSEEQLEELADAIAGEVRGAGPVVEADMVGDLAERGLARLDPVTAIQFASVYRNLADLDELAAVVQRYRDEALPGSDQLALDGARFPSGPQARIGGPPREGQGDRHPNRRRHAGKP
jgi:transcriptional regulator NrdR family protein